MNLSEDAQRWLIDGEHGTSSRAMFNQILLGRSTVDPDYPHDIDDFQRCERLLRMVPEMRPRLGEMAGLSAPWAALVESWRAIVEQVEADLPGLLDGGWSTVRLPWPEYRNRRGAREVFEAVLRRGQHCSAPGCPKDGTGSVNGVWWCWEHNPGLPG